MNFQLPPMVTSQTLFILGLRGLLEEMYGGCAWDIVVTQSHRDIGFFVDVFALEDGQPTRHARKHIRVGFQMDTDEIVDTVSRVVFELAESLLPPEVVAERRYLEALEHFIAELPSR